MFTNSAENAISTNSPVLLLEGKTIQLTCNHTTNGDVLVDSAWQWLVTRHRLSYQSTPFVAGKRKEPFTLISKARTDTVLKATVLSLKRQR
jgi:hypothetical protein